MEAFIAIATVAAIASVGILSPGPDFVAVSYAAVSRARRQAALVAAGVVLGNGIWAAAALLGVATLFALFPSLFLAIKALGALYLLWLGLQLLRNARRPIAAPVGGQAPAGAGALFAKGLSTTLANPKAALYYASALSSAAPAGAGWWLLAAMLLAVIAVAAAWFALVVGVLTTPRAAAAFGRFKLYFESFFGCLLIAFGLRQLLARLH
jgi:threonine/homoserine/homoserine lactone efflux protein